MPDRILSASTGGSPLLTMLHSQPQPLLSPPVVTAQLARDTTTGLSNPWLSLCSWTRKRLKNSTGSGGNVIPSTTNESGRFLRKRYKRCLNWQKASKQNWKLG